MKENVTECSHFTPRCIHSAVVSPIMHLRFVLVKMKNDKIIMILVLSYTCPYYFYQIEEPNFCILMITQDLLEVQFFKDFLFLPLDKMYCKCTHIHYHC